jgi:hypothetical protein
MSTIVMPLPTAGWIRALFIGLPHGLLVAMSFVVIKGTDGSHPTKDIATSSPLSLAGL